MLLPGTVFFGVATLLVGQNYGTGNTSNVMAASALGFFLNVILNLLLIPRMGILGAALVSSITYIVSTLYLAINFSNKWGHGLSELFIVNREDLQKLRTLLYSLV